MARAHLDGVALLADEPVEWSFASGTSPASMNLRIAASEEAHFRSNMGAPIDLVLEDQHNGNVVRIRDLFVTAIQAAGDPNFRALTVMDRRWKWPRRHVRRTYNIRRRVGTRALLGTTTSLGDITQADDVTFTQFSLDSGKPWTAKRVLDQLMRDYEEPVKWGDGTQTLASMPIDDLELDDDFASAIGRVLTYIPGLSIYVDADGFATFYNALARSSIAPARSAGPIVVDGNWSLMQDNAALRPREINVLFTREIEVRFDSTEGSQTPGPGLMALENVLPIPDPILIVNGQGMLAGQWITIDDAIAAWNADGLPAGADPLSHDLIQRRWFHGMFAHYCELGMQNPNVDWTARISCLRNHYRQTYRIQRTYMDRFWSLRANRVAVLDTTTGARAASAAYCDYCILPTERGLFAFGNQSYHGLNVAGYAEALADGYTPPTTISIIDEEQGVLRIEFRGDPLTRVNELIPSRVDNLPTACASNLFGSRAFEELPRIGQPPALAQNHGLCFVLTTAPAAPNSNVQLQKITIRPSQAEAIARRAGVDLPFLPASGPPMDVRIGAGTMTAKFAWLDTDDHASNVHYTMVPSEQFEDEIGTDPSAPLAATAFINRSECEAVAAAAAAVVYAAMADRVAGAHTTIAQPGARITGTVDRLTHTMSPTGALTTTFSLPASPQAAYNLFSFLPSHVRRTILRSIQP